MLCGTLKFRHSCIKLTGVQGNPVRFRMLSYNYIWHADTMIVTCPCNWQGFENNSLVKAGSRLPTEMVAVVRPTTSKVVTPKLKGTVSARMEQKHIVSKLPLEMILTVTAFKFQPPEKPAPDRYERGQEIFISQPVKSSTRNGLSGFYCFKIGAEKCLDVLSSTTGTYLLTFSLVSSCKNSHTKQQIQF